MNIIFCNGTLQTQPLLATIVLPSITVNPEKLDFGLVFVGQKTSRCLTIENLSTYQISWNTKVEGRNLCGGAPYVNLFYFFYIIFFCFFKEINLSE